jgi:hypothetical protein
MVPAGVLFQKMRKASCISTLGSAMVYRRTKALKKRDTT